MDCCQTDAIEELMNREWAQSELRSYRQAGPAKTTRVLLSALSDEGMAGMSLLDIGGGIGAIQHAFLEADSPAVISVDASSAYLEAARQEANQRGHGERLQQLHGDFVKVAGQVPQADVVTLDRVICCYGDMPNLVRLSTERARRLYAVVYPRDHWLGRLVVWLENLYYRVRGNGFRAYVHATVAVDLLVSGAGFQRIFSARTLMWQVCLYRRTGAPMGPASAAA